MKRLIFTYKSVCGITSGEVRSIHDNFGDKISYEEYLENTNNYISSSPIKPKNLKLNYYILSTRGVKYRMNEIDVNYLSDIRNAKLKSLGL